MDSLTSADLEALEAAGAALVRHPVRKDQTDLELAVAFALGCGALEVIVIGGLGNRWDQTLANLLLTAHPEFHGINLSFLDGYQRIYPVNGTITIEGRPGDTVSLIPIGGDAHGVTTHGLEYALEDGTISFGSTLGVSNVLTEQRATVEVKQGIV
ncbi:MAG: thiamine diphosphokinase, partial [Planctomycetales bacterium]|nr:thiamine diphosphokinase [Planctomycetales bacterium]NIN09019.1 thiamine diphosphokinase [Planctomycetales bacterium]NIP05197.1 thiamine diphosphokinase [Planctomycetales bacterium]